MTIREMKNKYDDIMQTIICVLGLIIPWVYLLVVSALVDFCGVNRAVGVTLMEDGMILWIIVLAVALIHFIGTELIFKVFEDEFNLD